MGFLCKLNHSSTFFAQCTIAHLLKKVHFKNCKNNGFSAPKNCVHLGLIRFVSIFRLFGWTIFSWARPFSPSFLITHKTKTTPSKPPKTFFNFRNICIRNHHRNFCCSMVLMLARVIIPAVYGLEVILWHMYSHFMKHYSLCNLWCG